MLSQVSGCGGGIPLGGWGFLLPQPHLQLLQEGRHPGKGVPGPALQLLPPAACRQIEFETPEISLLLPAYARFVLLAKAHGEGLGNAKRHSIA